MRYKVFDLIENKYIKDNKLCLKPNGKIVINDCGDEINISNSNISIKFYPTDTDNYYFDENGKVYDYRNTIVTDWQFRIYWHYWFCIIMIGVKLWKS